jgi:hypothetical protein
VLFVQFSVPIWIGFSPHKLRFVRAWFAFADRVWFFAISTDRKVKQRLYGFTFNAQLVTLRYLSVHIASHLPMLGVA